MQLPVPLEPWRPWLGLIAPELVEALGELLLQLHPLLGKMRMGAPRPDDLPVGAGNIVRRGAYERMLASEWLYADNLPDEFLRRAASHELLFIGPEPDRSRRSRLCVALFDTGPMQLGAPRLAHLALFILLARRAEDAGAEFRWGVLQQPGRLHTSGGEAAVLEMIASRTLEAASDGHALAWDAFLDQQSDLADCWQVGDSTPQLARLRGGHMAIVPSLLGDVLRLQVSQGSAIRTVTLALPAPETGVRLLRHPFRMAPPPAPAPARVARSLPPKLNHLKPSLTQAPYFSADGQWLGFHARDGAAVMHRLGQQHAVRQSKPRYQHPPKRGVVLGAAMFDKSLGQIVEVDDGVRFSFFPGRFFQSAQCPMPPPEQFTIAVGRRRVLPVFHVSDKTLVRERVIALTPAQQLVCWTKSGGGGPVPSFAVISTGVIGAAQGRMAVTFAQCVKGQIHLYEWGGAQEVPRHLTSFAGVASRALYGAALHGQHTDSLVALELSASEWLVRNEPWITPFTLTVPKGATAIGLVQPALHAAAGLAVLSADRHSVTMLTAAGPRPLYTSARALARVALDPGGRRLACLTQDGRELRVLALENQDCLLALDFTGADHES